VGICSTTYGDLVCRGCKRFAHEIDQWNGYDDGQRQLVWERLYKLREGAVQAHLRIHDETRLMARAAAYRIPDLASLDVANVAYEVIRRAGRESDLAALGIAALQAAGSALELYERVEGELYRRAKAQYERDFHVPVE
jgi:hypothetical protein